MTRFTRALCSQTKDKELIVYGTGAVGEVVSHALLAWGRKPDLYCDHNPEQHVFLDREGKFVRMKRVMPEFCEEVYRRIPASEDE